MQHTSISMNAPIEVIEVKPFNPLISKCKLKAFYVSDEANRNGTVIDKETAKKIANSIPGSPIVGYYNESDQDFEGHKQIFEIKDGKLIITPLTKPYGFVDLNAKVWFEKFLDDDEVEREYVVTEGYLWTGQFKEAQRIIDKGNNQSMELDDKTLKGFWSEDDKSSAQLFIINEAIISKFCILGEDVEPCFEGATITKIQFSFEDNFKEQLYSMMQQVIEYEGGACSMFNQYAVEIGDALWCSIHSYLLSKYPGTDEWSSAYIIEGVYEENVQKFAIIKNKDTGKYQKLSFSISESNEISYSDELVDVTKTFTPAAIPQFALEDIEAFEAEYAKKKKEEEEKKDEENKEEEEDNEDNESSIDDDEDKKKKDKKEKYNLDEIEEYTELSAQYEALKTEFEILKESVENLNSNIETLTNENSELREFKLKIEKKDKENMINDTFFMLSDEDKKDVIENIDKYSLDEIEAKLSVICVRNKVNFNLEDDMEQKGTTTYNLDNGDYDEAVPAWVSAVLKVQESKNNI